MMGQELFENPRRQYEFYRITPQDDAYDVLGDPDDFPAEGPTDEQSAAMEDLLSESPEDVLTFDPSAKTWISGREDDINRLFADRDEFLDALEAGEDPGV